MSLMCSRAHGVHIALACACDITHSTWHQYGIRYIHLRCRACEYIWESYWIPHTKMHKYMGWAQSH